jgi:hypothetical protein
MKFREGVTYTVKQLDLSLSQKKEMTSLRQENTLSVGGYTFIKLGINKVRCLECPKIQK